MKRPADTDISIPSSPADSPSPCGGDSSSGPPRKRARSEITPEERREARAHRNRIAAQNSRDRRKAQFTHLEQRVAELEEENRQLRAGMGLALPSRPSEQKDEEREKDKARDQENEELKERIKTLENGWEAVMKALAASGLPLNMPPASSSLSTSPSSMPSPPVTSGHPSTTAFPAFAPPSPIFPISPALSHSSSGSSTLFDSDDFDSTRHLARVATTDAPRLSSVSLQRLDLNIPPPIYPQTIQIGDSPSSAVDEVTMDDLFREILAPSPVSAQACLPADSAPTRSRSQSVSETPSHTAPVGHVPALPEIDWESEVVMQRLLAMLPVIQPDANPADSNMAAPLDEFPSALELELTGWDLAAPVPVPPTSVSVY